MEMLADYFQQFVGVAILLFLVN